MFDERAPKLNGESVLYWWREGIAPWEPTKAQTMRGAKVAAQRGRHMLNSDLQIGVEDDYGPMQIVSRRYGGQRQWEDVEFQEE